MLRLQWRASSSTIRPSEMAETHCSDPISVAVDADCDITRVSENPRTDDVELRCASSLSENEQVTSKDGPPTPLSPSSQVRGTASSGSGNDGITAEQEKRFSERASGIAKTSTTASGCTSPSSSSLSSRCSRNNSLDSPSHSSECCAHYTEYNVKWRLTGRTTDIVIQHNNDKMTIYNVL